MKMKKNRPVVALLIIMAMLATMFAVNTISVSAAPGDVVNLSRGKVSSTGGGASRGAYPVSFAFDGIYNPSRSPVNGNESRWSAFGATVPIWLQVDLGYECDITQIKISEYGAASGVTSFDLLVSSNGTVWNTLTTGTGIGANYVYDVNAPAAPVFARFFRLNVKTVTREISLWEIDVMGRKLPMDVIVPGKTEGSYDVLDATNSYGLMPSSRSNNAQWMASATALTTANNGAPFNIPASFMTDEIGQKYQPWEYNNGRTGGMTNQLWALLLKDNRPAAGSALDATPYNTAILRARVKKGSLFGLSYTQNGIWGSLPANKVKTVVDSNGITTIIADISALSRDLFRALLYSTTKDVEAEMDVYQLYLSKKTSIEEENWALNTELKQEQITTKVNGNNVEINVNNASNNKTYQYWSYQQVSTDMQSETQYYWVLRKEFSTDKTVSFAKAGATDRNGNYTTLVRYKEDGAYKGQFVSTVSGKSAGEVKIDSISINDKVITGTVRPKEPAVHQNTDKTSISASIVKNSNAVMKIAAPNATSITVDGVAAPGGMITLPGDRVGAKKIVVEATGAGGSDTIEFVLTTYNEVKPGTSEYATIDSLTATQASENQITVSQTGTAASYKISVSDLGLTSITGSQSTTASSNTYKIPFQKKAYGHFVIRAYAKSGVTDGFDHSVIHYVDFERPGTNTLTATATVGGAEIGTDSAINVNDTVTFNATAAFEGTTPEFSYVKQEDHGFVRLKQYDASGAYTWTPTVPGNYIIKVHAKGVDAAAAEIIKEYKIKVGSPDLTSDFTYQIQTLDGQDATEFTARVPGVFKVTTAEDEQTTGVQYSLDVHGTGVDTKFTGSNELIFTPPKPGTYTITIGARKAGTAGVASKSKTFTVTAN